VKIAILGAGDVGTAVAGAAVETGNQVTLTAEHTGKAREVADQVGATTAAGNADAVRDADVAVLAVPFSAAKTVAGEIRDAAAGKIVIDATNPLKADFSGMTTGERSGAEELQQLLPDTAVVKAFNTVLGTEASSAHHR
jgi:8-hydroxy-5-deazaflavin:NADPH oxidoreductase